MNESIFGAGVIGLMAMAVIWFAALAWMFRRLRIRHPTTYESIGSPSLVWNGSMRNSYLFLKFLWSRRIWELNDSTVAHVAVFMRLWLVVYFAIFLGILAHAITSPPQPSTPAFRKTGV